MTGKHNQEPLRINLDIFIYSHIVFQYVDIKAKTSITLVKIARDLMLSLRFERRIKLFLNGDIEFAAENITSAPMTKYMDSRWDGYSSVVTVVTI